MNLHESLTRIGLTDTEAKIYIALIKLKESTAVQLAKRTEVHRRTIYDNLNILLHKGLVSFKIKNSVKYFQATNPKSLSIFLEEKNRVLEEILPSLQGFYESHEQTPTVNIFVGVQGAKSLIEEAITSKKQIYWVGGGSFFLNSLTKSRLFLEHKTSQMSPKTVQPQSPSLKKLATMIPKDKLRVLPKSFLSRMGYLIYGGTVIIGVIQKKEITLIKIDSKECAQGFLNYFNVMWRIAKPLKT